MSKLDRNEFLKLINSSMLDTPEVMRYSGLRQSEPESLSDHVVDVMMMSYIIGLKLRSMEVEVDVGTLLEKCLVHDIDEVLIGDIPRLTKYSSEGVYNGLSDLADEVAKDMSYDIDGGTRMYDAWKYSKDDSLEGYILKLVDMLSVVSKVVLEVDTLGNKKFMRVALEVSEYIKTLIRDIPTELFSTVSMDYITNLLESALWTMKDLEDRNEDYMSRYNVYDDVTRGIVSKRYSSDQDIKDK